MDDNFVIIGNGEIDDKAIQLVEKTPSLIDIGFHVPKRTILSENYFDDLFQRTLLGRTLREVEFNSDLESKIRNGNLSKDEFDILRNISFSYGIKPLAIRSSAQGDSRGTGTYTSDFCENKVGIVKKSLLNVLASYFSESAIAFRKDANTGEGFGIIIEPIIGQNFDYLLAPVLSGFGYTSTSKGEGHIVVVPGIGGGVDTKNGEKITESIINKFDDLEDYIFETKQAILSSYGEMQKRKSALLKTERLWDFMNEGYNGKAYCYPTRYHKGEVVNTSLEFGEYNHSLLSNLNLKPFFEMIKKMEDKFKSPQYFEFAVTIDNKVPTYWITQIANTNKKLDLMDFEDLGNVIFMGHTVTGTGIQENYNIATCWNPTDIEGLHRYNQDNKNYVLLFSSRLTTSGNSGEYSRLRYSNFSNASVFLEI